MLGVLGRIARTIGRTRADMAPGCNEQLSLSFLLYVWRFHREKRPRLVRLSERRAGWQLYTLRSRRDARELPARFAAGQALTSPA
jgi:hypothetical protein